MGTYRISTLVGAVALAALTTALPAAASTFNISPIRAQLSSAHRTEVLTLMNAEDQPVVVQIHVVAWSQKDGEEQLVDTREILATPPVLQIPAMGEQIVRVALRRDADPARELTYRVIFDEVPQAAPANFTGLRVALRLSVPVFVTPAQSKLPSELAWEAHALPDGRIEVAATNHGSRHLQVTDFNLDAKGAATSTKDTAGTLRGMTAKYVLPGSRMTWTLQATEHAAAPPNSATLVIHGHSDQGDFSADVAFNGR